MPWSGRVEGRINGEWGTVCDTGFDVKAGNIVCRNLGFGSVKRIAGRASYGRGVGTIHLTQLRCASVNIGMESVLRFGCVYTTIPLVLKLFVGLLGGTILMTWLTLAQL